MVTTAPGLVELVAGGYTINGTITTTNVQLINGSLAGINVIAGGFNWVVGSWSGSVTVAVNTLLQMTSGNDHNMPNCIVTNLGTVAWSGGRIRNHRAAPSTRGRPLHLSRSCARTGPPKQRGSTSPPRPSR